ncbi:alpha/beta hydrolase [Aerophototrophica crusticola]|uniref:Alpha/beta hydrolase n=2 Tax=Aerophototrophica crusticola TaxID=1709002 RepID=A0A858RBS6_9PROT|nr:alpha/beta hydrolase [Rhodospirillaceae bacterium B3]
MPETTRRRRPSPLRLLVLAAGAIALAGCNALLNGTVPGDGYAVSRDLAYGDGPRRTLDLYVPDGAPADAPLLVFIYGGSWDSGSKGIYPFVGQAFASRGYVTAIPDYRVYPEVRFPGFIEDAAAATVWVEREVAKRRGARPRAVFLAGHSAGAHIALMLALDPTWIIRAGGDACVQPAAAVGLAGPYDFLPLTSERLKQVFGPGPAGPETQPISFAGGGDPPLLLLHGTDDDTVLPRNAERLAAAVNAAGGQATVKLYDGVGHIRIVGALQYRLRFLAPVLDDADGFLKSVPACHRRSD